jgi:hypothetical protein
MQRPETEVVVYDGKKRETRKVGEREKEREEHKLRTIRMYTYIFDTRFKY